MPKLSEAYVVGLLSDAEEKTPRLTDQLTAAKKKASAVDAELTNLLRRLDASRTALKQAQQQATRTSASINDGNSQISTLHQEIAAFKKKAEDIKIEMGRVYDEPAIKRKLRRGRAKLTVQIEEREEEIAAIQTRMEKERLTLAEVEAVLIRERDRSRVLTEELKKLQSQLPSPYLYTELFETVAARAHCRLYLDADLPAWEEEMREAIAWAHELHRELRLGKYPLDRNSDLVGGRAMGTAEAIYGAVALGDAELAMTLFEVATDPGLYFHQIFNVFRVWCLGLFLGGRERELRELLRLHQFAEGLRGGYVHVFIGLLTRDSKRVSLGIKDITKHEWELWQDPSLTRGAGVINLGAVALSRLARTIGVVPPAEVPTVPAMLTAAPLPRTALRLAR